MNDEHNSSPGFFRSLMKFLWNTLVFLFGATLISVAVYVTVRDRFQLNEKNCQWEILGKEPRSDDVKTFSLLSEMTAPNPRLEGRYFMPVEEMKKGKIIALTKENCYDRLFGGGENVVPLMRDLVEKEYDEWEKRQREQEEIDKLKQRIEQLERRLERLQPSRTFQ